MPQHKKAKRKGRRKSDYVSMGFRIRHLPRGVSKSVFFRGLREAVHSGELPAGWEIEWQWRNKRGGTQLSDDFESTIRNSRGGWGKLMLRTIARAERRARG